jgi:hypothetical protein
MNKNIKSNKIENVINVTEEKKLFNEEKLKLKDYLLVNY